MTKVFICPICRYRAKQKAHLEKHLLGVETRKHQGEPEVISLIKQKLYRMYPHRYQELEESQPQSHSYTQMGPQILTQNNVQVNIQGNVDITNHQIINQLHYWGNINKEMLDCNFMCQLVKGAIPHNASEMFEHVFYNEDYPENFIVYAPNKKLTEVKVFTENGWQLMSGEKLYQNFMEKTYREEMYQVLDHFLRCDIVSEREHEDLSNRLYEDEHLDDIKQDLRHIMINQREKVKPVYQQTKHLTNLQKANQIKVQGGINHEQIPALKVVPKKKLKIRTRIKPTPQEQS